MRFEVMVTADPQTEINLGTVIGMVNEYTEKRFHSWEYVAQVGFLNRFVLPAMTPENTARLCEFLKAHSDHITITA